MAKKKFFIVPLKEFKEHIEYECSEYTVLSDNDNNTVYIREKDTDNGHVHFYNRKLEEVSYEIGIALGINSRNKNYIKQFHFKPNTQNVLVECVA